MDCIRIIVLLILIRLSNIRGCDIIELNHDLGPHSPFIPVPVNTTFKLTVQETGCSRGFWVAFSEIQMQQLISTHVSAPYSLFQDGVTIDQIPFKELFAIAAVIDVRDKVVNNHFYEVTVEDVKNWQQKNGMFPDHCIILFNTGWDEEGGYPDQLSYFGSVDDIKSMKFPGVTLEAMEYIFSHETSHGIHFVGAGIDGPDLDFGGTEVFPVERYVSELNKYFVANLKELKRLPPKGAELMIMPLKIKGGEAAPTRVAARIPWIY